MKKGKRITFVLLLTMGMESICMGEAESKEWSELEGRYDEVNKRAQEILSQTNPTLDDVTTLLKRVPPPLVVKDELFLTKYTDIKQRVTNLSTLLKDLSNLQSQILAFKKKLVALKAQEPERIATMQKDSLAIKDKVRKNLEDIQIRLEALEGIKQRSTQLTSMPTYSKELSQEEASKKMVQPLIDVDKADALIDRYKTGHPDLDAERLKQKIFLASMPSLKKQKMDVSEGAAASASGKETNLAEAIFLIDDYINSHSREDVSWLQELKKIITTPFKQTASKP